MTATLVGFAFGALCGLAVVVGASIIVLKPRRPQPPRTRGRA